MTSSDREAQCVHDFYENTCGCSRLYGKPCSSIVDRNVLNDYRNVCLETDKSELDMLIKVQLFHHRNNSSETSAKKHKTKERERVRQVYHFSGIQVCRETFAFAHGISRKTIDSIARSLDQDGFGARVHGNKGKSPKHALTMEDVKRVKQFLLSYANKYGLPLPGRLPNFRNEKTILLPSDKTKAEVHQEYLTLADEMSLRKICLSQFKTVWLEQCPHILIMKPATDLCHTCQSFSSTLSCSGNLNEEEKEDILSKYQEHVGHVKEQRDHYRDQCAAAKSTFVQLTPEQKIRGQPPCTLQSEFHYSFDYAQQVHYPHYAQQVGPLFFKTPRKCQCFGICCEGSGTQIFYLVDEAQHSNKGANTVTSMLHHHFMYHGLGETDVKLHMDNCSGQNKNNTVIGYGMWRVMTGLHESVEFSMMEAGHTKFNPDWHFGLWKVKWRHSNVETLAEIAASVLKSSRNGHNVPQLVDDPVAPLFFYDWATFFKRIFKPIPSLKSYHHFSMTLDLRRESKEGSEKSNDDPLSHHCHTEKNQDIFDKKARRQLIIASIFCSLFMVGEAVGGALAGSLAIMSDAAHLLTDFASFGISLVAMHLTVKRRTKKLSFGWYRAEIIGALVSILFLWILTGVLVYLGVERIINPDYTIDPLIMLITASVGVVINVIMGATLHQPGHHHHHSHGGSPTYTPTDSGHQSQNEDNSHETDKHLLDDKQKLVEYGAISNQNVHDVEKNDHGHSHKKEKNINVRAAFIHVLGDLVQSLGVLIAAIIIWFKPEWKIADPICTFLFSILVVFTTMHIVKDIIYVLMEGAPRTVNFTDVTQSLLEVEGVKEVHDLRMWSLSMNKIAIAVHLAVEKDRDPMDVLRISTRIVRKKFGISESVIQIEEYHPTMSECNECQDPPD